MYEVTEGEENSVKVCVELLIAEPAEFEVTLSTVSLTAFGNSIYLLKCIYREICTLYHAQRCLTSLHLLTKC